MKKFILVLLSLLLLALPVSGKLRPEENAETERLEKKKVLQIRTELDEEGNVYPRTGMGEEGRKNTVMIYLCGSDLEYGGAATRDLKEMICSGYDQDANTVLVMAGGVPRWNNKAVDPGETAIYEIVGQEMVKRYSKGMLSMGDDETLRLLLQVGYENYPASQFSLIVWDHGSGPVGPLVLDELDSSHMTLLSVKEALETSPFAQTKLSWVGFDACLMGSMELAAMLAPYADYMIASQMSEPNHGWDYSFLKGLEEDEAAADTGERIVSAFMKQKNEMGFLTLACVDLAKMAVWVEKADSFFEELEALLSDKTYKDLSAMRNSLKSYEGKSLDLVDTRELIEAAGRILPAQASELLKTLDEVFVSRDSDISGPCGLSMYFPYYDLYTFQNGRREIYEQLGYSTGFGSFLARFLSIETGTPLASWSSLTKAPEEERDTQTSFTLKLEEDQADHLLDSSLVVLAKLEDAEREKIPGEGEVYYIVNDESKPVILDNVLQASFVHKALYVVGEEGSALHSYPLPYSIDSEGRYLLEGYLLSGEERRKVLLLCELIEESQMLDVKAMKLWDELGGYYSERLSVDPDSYEQICFPVPLYEERRDEEQVLYGVHEWEKTGEIENTFPLSDESLSLAFLLDTLDREGLYAAFEMTDDQQRTHTNELVALKAQTSDTYHLTYDNMYFDAYLGLPVMNNGDLYLYFSIKNKSDREIFVCLTNLVLKGKPIEAQTWIEGDGEYGGVCPGAEGGETLIVPMDQLEGLEDVLEELSFSLDFRVEDAETEEELASVQVNS